MASFGCPGAGLIGHTVAPLGEAVGEFIDVAGADYGGKIAELDRFRSPVTGSVRLSLTRGAVASYGAALVSALSHTRGTPAKMFGRTSCSAPGSALTSTRWGNCTPANVGPLPDPATVTLVQSRPFTWCTSPQGTPSAS
jgi:hypothetical protein